MGMTKIRVAPLVTCVGEKRGESFGYFDMGCLSPTLLLLLLMEGACQI